MSEKSSCIKKRNWAFVLYPESAPVNWMEKLQLTGLNIAISPLHEYDINPDNTPKKAHYHIILCYSGPTSFNVVSKLTSELNQPIPIALEQIKGYYRYFTHKDNPEKYQYSESDIKTLNGFNVIDYVELTNSENLELKRKIIDLIRELDFYEYYDLIEYLSLNNELDLLNCASSNTLFFNSFIKSKRHRTQFFNT